jgi:adenine-specific DNA-methyltransferase
MTDFYMHSCNNHTGKTDMNPDCLNRFHLGDCTKIMPTLPSGSVDFILTDPPYLVNYRSRDGRRIAGDIDDSWLQPAFAAWRKAGFRIVGHFVFAKHYASRKGYTEARHECAYLLAKGTPQAPECAPRDVSPWGKYTGNRLHPTQKPAEMLAPLIAAYSQIGDTVLDPFAGSGSTLLAAKHLRRAWIGIETDETYYRNERWSRFLRQFGGDFKVESGLKIHAAI